MEVQSNSFGDHIVGGVHSSHVIHCGGLHLESLDLTKQQPCNGGSAIARKHSRGIHCGMITQMFNVRLAPNGPSRTKNATESEFRYGE